MLYDAKRWDRKDKTDPFSMGSLASWLKRQPSRKRYEYTSGDSCLLAQYFAAKGFGRVTIGGNVMTSRSGRPVRFPSSFDVDVAMPMPGTFGAARRRATALVE